MYLFEPVGDVFTINALDKDGPLMGVVGIHSGGSGDGIESFSNAPIDLRALCQKGICSLIHCRVRLGDLRTEGSVDGNALDTRFSRLSIRIFKRSQMILCQMEL